MHYYRGRNKSKRRSLRDAQGTRTRLERRLRQSQIYKTLLRRSKQSYAVGFTLRYRQSTIV